MLKSNNEINLVKYKGRLKPTQKSENRIWQQNEIQMLRSCLSYHKFHIRGSKAQNLVEDSRKPR